MNLSEMASVLSEPKINFVHLYYVTGRVYFSLESIEGIVDAIVSTFNFCQKQKIDLIWHIDAKMKFNSFCLPKNGGKKY